MPLAIEVPNDIRSALQLRWDDLSAHVLEHLAVEGYRQGLLSLAQLRRLLSLPTPWDSQVLDHDALELDREAVLEEHVARHYPVGLDYDGVTPAHRPGSREFLLRGCYESE